MLDPKLIREQAELVKAATAHKCMSVDVDAWLHLDARRLTLLQEVEALRAERNNVAESMKSAQSEDRPLLIEKGKNLKEVLALKEEALQTIEGEWKAILLSIPNLNHPKAPIGNSDAENIELRQVGEITRLVEPRDHVYLCQKHDLIDFDRGTKVTGAKFYFLKGKLAILEMALIRYVQDYLMKEGFILMNTPDLAKDDVIIGTGFNPRGPETQIYSLENTDLSLIGTAEITLGGFHKDEFLSVSQLPIRYAGVSHCYRTEAGSYGRESYGLYRVHQFSKIEMFVFCTPEQSEAMHLELLRHEEHIFESLKIPFRVLDICTGDLGGSAYRKYDLEAWMWGRNNGLGDWGEITSTSNCTDYQARRMNIKYKKDDGSSAFVNTLNGTAISLARTLIALLENHQQADGSIRIPEKLIPYCGFDSIG
ncbi:serine--tRNA ligase [Candidatus Uhrbacteria bacterium]|nr:serine--tRNA ligase [Candidatus Uhrbacteria bacterium]